MKSDVITIRLEPHLLLKMEKQWLKEAAEGCVVGVRVEVSGLSRQVPDARFTYSPHMSY